MTRVFKRYRVLPKGRIDFKILMLIFSGTLLILFILDLFLGSVTIRPADIVNAIFGGSDTTVNAILTRFRVPKAITALLAGISLSISGLQMQTLFRNPLAGPYVLGISAGASLGVALVILGFSSNLSPDSLRGIGNWMIAAASWVGAGIVMLIIVYISSRVKDIMTVLIIGIMLSGGITAAVSIMQYFSSETMLKSYIVWTMGSLGNLTTPQISVFAVSVVFGIILSFLSVKMLNALLLGENYAQSIGLNIKLARIVIFSSTSILAGSVTAFCGPIGFIGIAVPHIARLFFRTSDHKILIPATILTGGAVMLASDIISQVPGSENVLPVNSITSLIGIPVVIWVILRRKQYSDLFR